MNYEYQKAIPRRLIDPIRKTKRAMNHSSKLWNLLLYAGLEKAECDALLKDIREENQALLKQFSQIAAIIFLSLLIVSMCTQGLASVNSTIYLICAVETLILLMASSLILPKHPSLVTIFVYVFTIMLHGFGMVVSVLHPDKPAVTSVVFLVVTPLMFYDRPIRMSLMIAAVVAAYCGIINRFKAPSAVESDVWNMLSFGVVGIIATLFMMRVRVRALAQSRQIELMGQTDLLTGAKNRNHYENRLREYPDLCNQNLFCVYADVNGLHEMNNTRGHEAGDRMLQDVAEALRQCFGAENTYRVGGDEFVAFRMDEHSDDMVLKIEGMNRSLSRKGYHVSFGTAMREKNLDDFNMYEMVTEAERNMFAAKREYYMQAGIDRRRR